MPDQPLIASPQNPAHVPRHDQRVGIGQDFALVLAESSPYPVKPPLILNHVPEPFRVRVFFQSVLASSCSWRISRLPLPIQESSNSLYTSWCQSACGSVCFSRWCHFVWARYAPYI
jgi:hypothetical protein